jgi:hypothetical protein
MGVTSNGLPYPENSDFVADGAMAIKDLADNVNAKAGLWKVIPSGATNGTVGANGDVTIGNAVSNVTVDGAFSSKYENYKITISGGVGSTNLALRFNFDGSTSGYYGGVIFHPYSTAGPANVLGVGWSAEGNWLEVGNASTTNIALNMDVLSPNLAKPASYNCGIHILNTAGSTVSSSGVHLVATAFTGFRIQTSTGTLTGGTIRIYGYN